MTLPPVQAGPSEAEIERAATVAWLRSHEGQHERAIAANQCTRFSTAHGELRDQAAYYCEAADAIEVRAHLQGEG